MIFVLNTLVGFRNIFHKLLVHFNPPVGATPFYFYLYFFFENKNTHSLLWFTLVCFCFAISFDFIQMDFTFYTFALFNKVLHDSSHFVELSTHKKKFDLFFFITSLYLAATGTIRKRMWICSWSATIDFFLPCWKLICVCSEQRWMESYDTSLLLYFNSLIGWVLQMHCIEYLHHGGAMFSSLSLLLLLVLPDWFAVPLKIFQQSLLGSERNYWKRLKVDWFCWWGMSDHLSDFFFHQVEGIRLESPLCKSNRAVS